MKILPHPNATRRPRGAVWHVISPGAMIILVIALVSGILILLRPARYADHDLELWAFADVHVKMYSEQLNSDWNPTTSPSPASPTPAAA